MALLHGLQVSFAGGEASPSLYGRVDLQKYLTFLKTARNVNVMPQGGIRNRAGTKYVASAGDSTHPVRLLPFIVSSTEAYVIELGHFYARFFTANAPVNVVASTLPDWVTSQRYRAGDFVEYADTEIVYYCVADNFSDVFANDLANGYWREQIVYEIITPWSSAVIFELKFAQSADMMFLAHPSLAPQVLTYYSSASWDIAPYQFSNGPFRLQNANQQLTLESNITKPSPGTPDPIIYLWLSYTGPQQIQLQFGGDHGLSDGDTIVISGTTGTYASINGTFSVSGCSGEFLTLCLLGTQTPYLTSLTGTNPIVPDGSPTATPNTRATITASSPLFNANHVNSLFEMSETIAAQSVSKSVTATGQYSTNIKCGHDWSIITAGAWVGVLNVQTSIDGGTTWITIRTLQSTGSDNYQTSGDSGYDQCLIRVLSSGTWSGTANTDLSSMSFDWNGMVQILGVTDSVTATAVILKVGIADTGLASTDPTWQWSEGSWSTYRGWPSAVTFYQDRLCWGGTPSEPQTIECSKTGSYNDFGVSSPLQADDGFSILLPSRQLNAIQNLVVMTQGMVALTSDSAFMVAPGGNGVFSASSVDVTMQGHRGSSSIDPVLVGAELLLMQQMGTVCRNFIFQLAVNGFMGDNISIISQHLFTGYSVVEMAYAQEPDSIVYAVRSDGKLLSCTYMRDQEMNAWTWHDTAGTFESVCTIPNIDSGYNQPWVVVKRGETRFIEYLVDRDGMGTTPSAQYFVDCGKSYNGSATVFSGLEHLANNTVAILADGNVIPNQVVSAGGTITLTTAATIVHVGLPFISDIETLRIEAPSQSGTTQGRRIAIPEVTIRFWNSRGGYFKATSQDIAVPASTGVDGFDEMIERADSDPADAAMPLKTQDYKVTLNGGFDFGAGIFFRQVSPLPLTILAFLPNLSVSDN